EPVKNSAFLRPHDFLHAQASYWNHYGENGHDRRDLVTDNLGGGAHASKKSIFIVGGPSGHNDTHYTQRGNRNDIKDPNVEITNDEILAKREYHESREASHKNNNRC